MPVTVRDALALDNFAEYEVLSGNGGLGREIRAMTFIDAPDSWKWIRGGEFVITLAFAFQSEEGLFSLVRALVENGASCLGLKTDRYIGYVPASVLNYSNEKNFPIIKIPGNVAFADIIQPVQSLVLNDQAQLLKYSEKVRHAFFDLSVRAASVKDILLTLRSFIHYNFVFFDIISDEKFHMCDPSSSLYIDIKDKSLPELLKLYPHEDITYEGKITGYFIFDAVAGSLTDTWREIPISQAKGAILLYMQRRNAKNQVEARYRNEFVCDILSSNIRMEKEVWNRARVFNWDLTGPQVVVIFDIDNYKKSLTLSIERNKDVSMLEYVKTRIFSIVRLFMISLADGVRYPYTELSDSIVYIIPADVALERGVMSTALREIIEKAVAKIKEETSFTLTIGVGEPAESVFTCCRSYEQAREGLELMRDDTGGDVIAVWSDMELYKLLHSISRNEDSKAFIEGILMPLIKADSSGAYMETLRHVIENNWNIKEAARKMGLHYNTLKYRCSRMWEIISVDPAKSEDRMKVMLACKLYKLCRIAEKK